MRNWAFNIIWKSGKTEKRIYNFRTEIQAYEKRWQLIADSCYNIVEIIINELVETKRSMKIELEKVTLRTMNFGSLDITAFDITDGCLIIDGIGEIKISTLIDKDLRSFQALNEHEDSAHQIDMESLTMVDIVIIEGATPTIRFKYAFEQDKGFWRSLDGETGEIRKYPNKPDNGKWFASANYTKGACVYW